MNRERGNWPSVLLPVVIVAGSFSVVLPTPGNSAAGAIAPVQFPPLAIPGPGGYDPAVSALDSCNRGGRNALGDVYLVNTVIAQCQQNRSVRTRNNALSGQVVICWNYTGQWTNLELQAESIEQQAAKTSDGRTAGALMNQAQATLNQARTVLITQAVCTNNLIASSMGEQFAANDNSSTSNDVSPPLQDPYVPQGAGGSPRRIPGGNNRAPMPGPAGGIDYRPAGSNACLPNGPGGYDYCANGPGARLPPGCICNGTSVVQNRAPSRLGGFVDSHDTVPKASSSPDGLATVSPGTGDKGLPVASNRALAPQGAVKPDYNPQASPKFSSPPANAVPTPVNGNSTPMSPLQGGAKQDEHGTGGYTVPNGGRYAGQTFVDSHGNPTGGSYQGGTAQIQYKIQFVVNKLPVTVIFNDTTPTNTIFNIELHPKPADTYIAATGYVQQQRVGRQPGTFVLTSVTRRDSPNNAIPVNQSASF